MSDHEGEVRELTNEDFQAFSSPENILPRELSETLGQYHPLGTPPKINIPLSRDVVDRFQATGDGWQQRISIALRDWLQDHNPASLR
jgi:uncharacterized protein (DUF4415 family)